MSYGYIHTIQALLPHLVDRGADTIVNISSIGSQVRQRYLAPYTTSKLAVTGLTQALHQEPAHKGIHAYGVYPT